MYTCLCERVTCRLPVCHVLFCNNNAAVHTGAYKQPTRLPGLLGERIIQETRVGGRRRGIEQLVSPAQNGGLHARCWRGTLKDRKGEEKKRETKARDEEKERERDLCMCTE